MEKLYKRKTKLTGYIKFVKQWKQRNGILDDLKLKDTTNINKKQKSPKNVCAKLQNNILKGQQNESHHINIEIETQSSILNCYLKTTQLSRRHEHDLKWIDRYGGKCKDELIKPHTIKLRNLKEKQESNELKQRAAIKKTKSQIKYDTTNVLS